MTLALVEDTDAAGEDASLNPSNTATPSIPSLCNNIAGEAVSTNPRNTVTFRVSQLYAVAPTTIVNLQDISAIVNPFLLQCGICKDGDLELVEKRCIG